MSCSPGGVYLAIVERTGVARVAAYRWFHAGVLPVRAGKVGRLILVGVRRCPRLIRGLFWTGRSRE